jgi:DNA-binding NtrC family response regulator
MKAVLVLEDDASSLSVLNWVLERDYRVVTARSPEEAVQIFSAEPLQLFIADNLLKTSRSSGIETLLSARQFSRDLPLLAISGTAPEGWPANEFEAFGELIRWNRFDFLQKPFTAKELKEIIAALTSTDWNSERIELIYTNALAYRQSAATN